MKHGIYLVARRSVVTLHSTFCGISESLSCLYHLQKTQHAMFQRKIMCNGTQEKVFMF